MGFAASSVAFRLAKASADKSRDLPLPLVVGSSSASWRSERPSPKLSPHHKGRGLIVAALPCCEKNLSPVPKPQLHSRHRPSNEGPCSYRSFHGKGGRRRDGSLRTSRPGSLRKGPPERHYERSARCCRALQAEHDAGRRRRLSLGPTRASPKTRGGPGQREKGARHDRVPWLPLRLA
jgi:hypothetical protein